MKGTHIVVQMRNSILHQWNGTNLVSFSMKDHLRGLPQFNVADTDIQKFLNPRTSIIEQDHHELVTDANFHLAGIVPKIRQPSASEAGRNTAPDQKPRQSRPVY